MHLYAHYEITLQVKFRRLNFKKTGHLPLIPVLQLAETFFRVTIIQFGSIIQKNTVDLFTANLEKNLT
jgi:hypothetical protein